MNLIYQIFIPIFIFIPYGLWFLISDDKHHFLMLNLCDSVSDKKHLRAEIIYSLNVNHKKQNVLEKCKGKSE